MRKAATIITFFLLISCSTTRVLRDGQYRLARNEINIEGAPELSSVEIGSYVKQAPNSYFIFGWNPFLNIYNWGSKNPDSKGFFKKIGTPPVVYNGKETEYSIENINNHLEYLGYFNSSVTSSVDTLRRLVKVKYNVRPGKRYRIDEILYELPRDSVFVAEFEADSANALVHTGDFLNEKQLEAESVRGASYFRNLGYYDISRNNYSFTADTLESGRTVLTYRLRPGGGKYRFGDVTIQSDSGATVKQSILEALITVESGDLYNERTVNNTYQRLTSMKVFNNVGVSLVPTDSNKVDCRVKLSESNPKGFKVNLEASSNSSGLVGVSPQISWYNKNAFHGGEWLTLGFTGDFQFKFRDPVRSTEVGANASLSLPDFLGLTSYIFNGPNIPRAEFKGAYNFQDRPEYTRHVFSFSYGYGGQGKMGKLVYQIFPIDVNYVRLRNIDPSFAMTLEKNPYMKYAYQDHLDAGLRSVLWYSNCIDIVPKIPYYYGKLSLDLSGNLFSIFNRWMISDESGQRLLFHVPYAQYIRGELDFGRNLRWGKSDGQSVTFRLLCGASYAYGNSNAVPFEKQFYAGGANSMRGWQARFLGPGFSKRNKSFSIPSQSGDFKLEADAEYRFNMFWKFEGALFAEAGNVWTYRNEDDSVEDRTFNIKSLAADWGIGLRMNLGFILLRLDWGMKVHDPSRDAGMRWLGPGQWFKQDGYAIHFGVGYPF